MIDVSDFDICAECHIMYICDCVYMVYVYIYMCVCHLYGINQGIICIWFTNDMQVLMIDLHYNDIHYDIMFQALSQFFYH